jgi:hypothetical protein
LQGDRRIQRSSIQFDDAVQLSCFLVYPADFSRDLLLIALATIGVLAFRAARANPVLTLRD